MTLIRRYRQERRSANWEGLLTAPAKWERDSGLDIPAFVSNLAARAGSF